MFFFNQIVQIKSEKVLDCGKIPHHGTPSVPPSSAPEETNHNVPEVLTATSALDVANAHTNIAFLS